jgi:hypothetical protein
MASVEIERISNQQSSETTTSRRRLEQIEREIRNCTEAIASMGLSNSLRERLTGLETQQREVSENLTASEPRAVKLQLRDTRRFVETRLKSLQSLWIGEARLVRAEIAKHVERITVTPEGRSYIASGTWDLLGSVAVTMVPGARLKRSATSPSRLGWLRDLHSRLS